MQIVEKVCFFKKVLVLYPYKNALWALRPAKPLAFYLGILAETPNPFPVVKGCVCSVGFASLQSPWAYTPGIRARAECGAAALTPLGATPQTPFILITIEFFDRLNCYLISDNSLQYNKNTKEPKERLDINALLKM